MGVAASAVRGEMTWSRSFVGPGGAPRTGRLRASRSSAAPHAATSSSRALRAGRVIRTTVTGYLGTGALRPHRVEHRRAPGLHQWYGRPSRPRDLRPGRPPVRAVDGSVRYGPWQ